MAKKFVVIYDWGYEITRHEFDTLEEAIEDRKKYFDSQVHHIYQLLEEKTIITLLDGTEIELK